MDSEKKIKFWGININLISELRSFCFFSLNKIISNMFLQAYLNFYIILLISIHLITLCCNRHLHHLTKAMENQILGIILPSRSKCPSLIHIHHLFSAHLLIFSDGNNRFSGQSEMSFSMSTNSGA